MVKNCDFNTSKKTYKNLKFQRKMRRMNPKLESSKFSTDGCNFKHKHHNVGRQAATIRNYLFMPPSYHQIFYKIKY